MADIRIGSGPFFERGIDSITFKAGEATLGLPEQRELSPAEQAQRPQLDQLLALPTLDDYLEQSIRPELAERDLLLPGQFRQALEGAIGTIAGHAGELQQADPEAVKVLNRASRLLNEEVGLRDLLQMYRSVLHQG